jgi:hypothetical protein
MKRTANSSFGGRSIGEAKARIKPNKLQFAAVIWKESGRGSLSKLGGQGPRSQSPGCDSRAPVASVPACRLGHNPACCRGRRPHVRTSDLSLSSHPAANLLLCIAEPLSQPPNARIAMIPAYLVVPVTVPVSFKDHQQLLKPPTSETGWRPKNL